MEVVSDSRGGGMLVIVVTIVIAMVLAVLPMPAVMPLEIGFLRPDWCAMVLIYWIIALPHRVGLFTAWFAGLAVDVLLGSLLGQHALAYVVLAYIATSLYQRLRMFSVWQQAIILFALLGLNQLLNFWAESVAGLASWSMWYLLPALSGAFLWPWVFLALRFLRRRLDVS